ncbi:MAG: hypothetical protein Q7R63_01660, partial [bacterium]|nr:hypothetical protein [bacterium]
LALQDFGVIPEGQWREALKSAFPKAPMFNVGVADASWRLPHEVGQFPCIRWNGESFFRHTSCVEFDSHDLWLVKVID